MWKNTITINRKVREQKATCPKSHTLKEKNAVHVDGGAAPDDPGTKEFIVIG
ncbi:MAG TPA: hypothetical protein VGJ42_01970 [Nitrososphaera sp.]|jgi:hypothetical protein